MNFKPHYLAPHHRPAHDDRYLPIEDQAGKPTTESCLTSISDAVGGIAFAIFAAIPLIGIAARCIAKGREKQAGEAGLFDQQDVRFTALKQQRKWGGRATLALGMQAGGWLASIPVALFFLGILPLTMICSTGIGLGLLVLVGAVSLAYVSHKYNKNQRLLLDGYFSVFLNKLNNLDSLNEVCDFVATVKEKGFELLDVVRQCQLLEMMDLAKSERIYEIHRHNLIDGLTRCMSPQELDDFIRNMGDSKFEGLSETDHRRLIESIHFSSGEEKAYQIYRNLFIYRVSDCKTVRKVVEIAKEMQQMVPAIRRCGYFASKDIDELEQTSRETRLHRKMQIIYDNFVVQASACKTILEVQKKFEGCIKFLNNHDEMMEGWDSDTKAKFIKKIEIYCNRKSVGIHCINSSREIEAEEDQSNQIIQEFVRALQHCKTEKMALQMSEAFCAQNGRLMAGWSFDRSDRFFEEVSKSGDMGRAVENQLRVLHADYRVIVKGGEDLFDQIVQDFVNKVKKCKTEQEISDISDTFCNENKHLVKAWALDPGNRFLEEMYANIEKQQRLIASSQQEKNPAAAVE